MRFFIIPFLLLIIGCKHENALIIRQPEKFVKADITPSAVDSLITNEDVSEYMRKIDTNFSNFSVADIELLHGRRKPEVDSIMKLRMKELGISNSFYKADFDNNGYSDLLVLGGWRLGADSPEDELAYDCFLIMNFENNTSKIFELQKDFRNFDVPEIRYYEGREPLLVIHSSENMDYKNPTTKQITETKLTGKFGVFTEYNEKPAAVKIERIEYEAGPCLGTCPMFKMTINKDGAATFFAEYYNFSEGSDVDFNKPEGTFKTNLKNQEFEQLMNVLNYIDFKNLKNQYSVRYTDAPIADITITYDNGKTKHIYDNGMKGTYGLRAVYGLLADLRFNQDWVKVK
ncbi:DUF6438 domain-containing protein [Flavobacterium sp. MFBS3-15]|uniref:DUF6438 domain-containing protein n=1 Tax=Flavobacterium sp. MFBS3-15 TaxID=2989816 RepID=UPI0022366E53|nr:DUF6438 domain-containing protein [Flavobacterium sp. MFBS3-15]MCW4468152.1 DUF6438 domain-containing protein [Flavobacterium sp. MFBS3-15]